MIFTLLLVLARSLLIHEKYLSFVAGVYFGSIKAFLVKMDLKVICIALKCYVC